MLAADALRCRVRVGFHWATYWTRCKALAVLVGCSNWLVAFLHSANHTSANIMLWVLDDLMKHVLEQWHTNELQQYPHSNKA